MIYTACIIFYVAFIRLASFAGNRKARSWLSGRRGWRQRLNAKMKRISGDPVWFHVSSLGEFEQIRPVIEALKKKRPALSIVLTFFSPSGYNVQKEYEGADFVEYLPADLPWNTRFFLNTVHPRLTVFVKYDLWWNFLFACKQRNIPVCLAAASYTEKYFRNPVKRMLFRKIFPLIHSVMVQNKESLEVIRRHFDHPRVSVMPDPRIDRVINIRRAGKIFPVLESFRNDNFCVICGSIHQSDERILFPVILEYVRINEKIKWILVPHEVSQGTIIRLMKNLPDCTTYSDPDPEKAILLIDCIGILSSIYSYANLVYVGGGFEKSVHNTLEPAAYHIPLIFGPRYKSFPEAVYFVKSGSGRVIHDSASFKEYFMHFYRKLEELAKAASVMESFFTLNSGGTEIISHYLESFLEKSST